MKSISEMILEDLTDELWDDLKIEGAEDEFDLGCFDDPGQKITIIPPAYQPEKYIKDVTNGEER